MTTYGSDFRGVTDIDAFWSFETDELKAFMQAIARRLICPPGALWYAPTYGYNLCALVADVVDTDKAARDIEAEVRKDERTGSCTATVDQVNKETLQVAVTVTPADPSAAPFTLTLRVTSVTVELLEAA